MIEKFGRFPVLASRTNDALATLFDDVRHVACLHDEPAPASALPYAAANLTLVGVPPAGGDDLAAKLDICRLTPRYVRTIVRELRAADAVHVTVSTLESSVSPSAVLIGVASFLVATSTFQPVTGCTDASEIGWSCGNWTTSGTSSGTSRRSPPRSPCSG